MIKTTPPPPPPPQAGVGSQFMTAIANLTILNLTILNLQ